MAVIGWVDLDTLEEFWPDAPADGPLLDALLTAAYETCAAYAPPMPLDADGAPAPPASWALAQIMHAKHLNTRSRAGDGSGIGADGYMIQTYPLVMEARSLLRPKHHPLRGVL